jgi:type IV pilus assembly protein PilX
MEQTLTPPRTSGRLRRAPAHQRGVVLFVALIVMVALSLAGVALIRSVDTATLVSGNLAFRQGAMPVANAAIEKAAFDLFEAKNIADTTADKTAFNYYASWRNNDNALGVPKALTDTSSYPAGGAVITDAASGMTARYVIERSCSTDGVATAGICDMMAPKLAPGGTAGKNPWQLPRIPFYRTTIRVDGPRDTVVYAQATLR